MKKNILLLFVLGLMFIPSTLSWAIAQWGSVKNHDGSVPDASYLTFISFIKGTDNVIRTKNSDGAIYENDIYQDETSNFPDVDVGDQYEIYFNYIISGAQNKAGIVNTTIPNLSSKNDITLVPGSNIPVPEGLKASVFPSGTIRLTWDYMEGLTYHLYRRIAGSPYYTHIDDATGFSRGLAGSCYIDMAADGLHNYYYILVAEDDMGQLSGHTDEVLADSSTPNIIMGDVSEDSTISAHDASLILQYVVGIISFTDEQSQRADVSGNGSITALDAALVLQKSVGLIETFPIKVESQASPPIRTFAKNLKRMITLSFENIKAKPGQRINFPLKIDDAQEIISGNIVISYDHEFLKFVGISAKSIVEYKVLSNINTSANKIEISFASSE